MYKIIRLETEGKRLTDAVKMACYRAAAQMHEAIEHHAAFARNLNEAVSFLYQMFRQPAEIIPNHDENRFEAEFQTIPIQRKNSALGINCGPTNGET